MNNLSTILPLGSKTGSLIISQEIGQMNSSGISVSSQFSYDYWYLLKISSSSSNNLLNY